MAMVDFDAACSVYRDAKDNFGRYVDDSGRAVQRMSIREFCLTDRWKPAVDRVRELRREFGKDYKSMPEYARAKQQLPGATLSGLFDLREVRDEKTGAAVLKSRVSANLKQHTGFLCIDIDAQDNQSIGDMRVVLRTLRHRPEVALIMRSCSGTGYFALIPLAFPDRHKDQFAALMKEYSALGIMLDRQCADITRVRFASYDDSPYVNPAAIPYEGLPEASAVPVFVPVARPPRVETADDLLAKVERLVRKIEQFGIDITGSYSEWIRVGLSLATLPDPWGRHYFHRVSKLNAGYNSAKADVKFSTLKSPRSISIATFFSICKDYGVTLA